MMTRRQLLVAIGAAWLAAPFRSLAQQPGKIWRVGFLAPLARPASIDSHWFGGFVQGMRELGYVEGRNLIIEWRFAENKPERLPGLAAELVQLNLDVLVGVAVESAQAFQKLTATMPIVSASGGDPVAAGLVQSLARPGGNITGLTTITGDLVAKRLEMLLAMVPKLSRVAVLIRDRASAAGSRNLASVQAAGKQRGATILPVQAHTPQEIDAAFASMCQQKAGALLVFLNPFFEERRSQIAELTAKYPLPSMTADRMYVEAGCLMSYGASLTDMYLRCATYVDRIFKGAKPADLPVEQPTKFELVINRKTAKALGLTIPQSLLISADRVLD
ncbi:MAG: ABC transporter substrate-binding protein [Betaproteobacteria bacterium]|nr:ABC transporter substrate-binding protein [Betaproteobacteria bacterium]